MAVEKWEDYYNPLKILVAIPIFWELICEKADQVLSWENLEKVKEYFAPANSFPEKSRFGDSDELKVRKEIQKNDIPFEKARLKWFWYEKWTRWLELDVVGILGIARLIEWLLYWNTTELRQRKELPIVKER